MRVTELYTVGNSNFNIEPDGTVNINIQLFMDSVDSIARKDISDLNVSTKDNTGGIKVVQLAQELESIKSTLKKIAGQSGREVSLPIFVQAMDVNSSLTLEKEALKEFRAFISSIQKASKDSDLLKQAAKLYRIFNNGKQNSDLTKLRIGRKQLAKNICDSFRNTPDPFLRSSSGVTPSNLAGSRNALGQLIPPKGKKKQNYVSYGKIMSMFVGKAFAGQEDTEVQLVFGSCNHNSGAIFDHNIAQIPIQIADFQGRLENVLATRGSLTVEHFIRFVHDEFISFDGTAAYGISSLIKPNTRAKDGTEVAAKGKKQLIIDSANGNPGAVLKHQQIEAAMLNKIYGAGKRHIPTFTKPDLSMRIVTKKATKDNGKNIIRVYFQDSAAGRTMTTADALMNLVRDGYTMNQDFSSGDPNLRGARHNEIFAANFGELSERGVIGDFDQAIKDKAKAGLKAEKLDTKAVDRIMEKLNGAKILKKVPESLRIFFFEKSPYMLFGTEGSGIIEASLSSEANDNLTSIFLSQRGSSGESKAPEAPTNLPFRVHPTSLDLTTFGCPFLHLMQKYFIDLGTNTTADNYYHVVGVTHNFEPGNFTTSLSLKPYDAYGTFENVMEKVDQIVINAAVAEAKKK